MKILVTGGAGYIGVPVVKELLNRNHDLVVLDALYWGKESLVPLLDRITLIEGDCRSAKDMLYSLEGVDAVIHLAGIVGESACVQNPKAHFTTNIESTRILVDSCMDPHLDLVRDFIYVSSCSVYGNTHGLVGMVDETTAPNPLTTYAESKCRSERIILEQAERTPHFHPTIARLTTAFGWSPRPRLDLVTNQFTYAAHKTGQITIHGSGNQFRSLIHVSDIATALADLLEAPRFVRSGQIFHVGAEENNKTLNELAEIVCAVIPGTTTVHVDKKTDRRNYAISCSKIRNLIGWEPEWSIEDGVKDLLEKLEHLDWDWESRRYRNNGYEYV